MFVLLFFFSADNIVIVVLGLPFEKNSSIPFYVQDCKRLVVSNEPIRNLPMRHRNTKVITDLNGFFHTKIENPLTI